MRSPAGSRRAGGRSPIPTHCPRAAQHLKNSGISINIKKLSKHGDDKVAKLSHAVMEAWKARCTPKDKAKPAAPAVKAEPTVKPEPEPVKVEPVPPVKAEELPPPVKVEVPPETAPPPIKQEASTGAGSSTSAIKRPLQRTGDSVRDSVREKLMEAYNKGVIDNEQYLREQETDTAAMAAETEVSMFEKFGGTSKDYKARFRSLVFNLKDPKNPEFIRQVVTGQRHVSDLSEMEVKEMASDQVKQQRQQWQENAKMALMDERSYKNYSGKGTEDGILKCAASRVETRTASSTEEPIALACSRPSLPRAPESPSPTPSASRALRSPPAAPL